MSKYLVAPLNWGLGHAARCVPLVQRLLDEGHEVVLGGDGESLTLLRRHFPKLRYVYLAPLNLRYSKSGRQVWAMVRSLPQLIRWAIKDHALLKAVLREEPFDYVISDNRFGLYLQSPIPNPQLPTTNHQLPITIYITHQLHIFLPRGWKWAEGIASRMHARIYRRYNKVWVPDYEDYDLSLAGELSHPQSSNLQISKSSALQISGLEYIGPLSRFSNLQSPTPNPQSPITNHQLPITNYQSPIPYDIVAVLSGLEPQRTILEKEIITRFQGSDQRVLVVQGLMNRPNTRFKRANITMVPYLGDKELAAALCGASRIIVRSGYSTVMDLDALGLLQSQNIEFIPTQGQPEQEYLAFWMQKRMQK